MPNYPIPMLEEMPNHPYYKLGEMSMLEEMPNHP
jgi:hypothetical protein